MNFDQVKDYLRHQNVPNFRFTQLISTIQKGGDSWDLVTGWPKELKERIAVEIPFTSWVGSEVFVSSDGTYKGLIRLIDGEKIESVLMQPKPGHWSVCISCEVGCAMNCAFCATGKMGFIRQLSSEEITDQILFWRNYIANKNLSITIKSVVFMGMGEPFHNTNSVLEAIGWLNTYYGFGARHISVSTSGIPEGIEMLSKTYPQVNLAISLHAATNEKRSSLMPVNRQFSLDILLPVLQKYLSTTHRQLMFEYLLINGVNDTNKDQDQLITFLSAFEKNVIHINLIRYNQTSNGFTPTPVLRVKQWKYALEQRGISVSIRKNLGTDIQGACGQLAGQSATE